MNRGFETIIQTGIATASQITVKWNAPVATPMGKGHGTLGQDVVLILSQMAVK